MDGRTRLLPGKTRGGSEGQLAQCHEGEGRCGWAGHWSMGAVVGRSSFARFCTKVTMEKLAGDPGGSTQSWPFSQEPSPPPHLAWPGRGTNDALLTLPRVHRLPYGPSRQADPAGRSAARRPPSLSRASHPCRVFPASLCSTMGHTSLPGSASHLPCPPTCTFPLPSCAASPSSTAS